MSAPGTATMPGAIDTPARRVDGWRDIGVPAAIRVADMLVQLAVLAWLGGSRGPSLQDRLTEWDASYYADIATHGYPTQLSLDAHGQLTSGFELAFSPLYPMVAGGVRVLGLSTASALLLVSAGFGIAAAVVVHLLGREILGSRFAGYTAAALLGALPAAVVLQMGYAESAYLAVAGAALLAALHRRWWLAATLALLAGLTRPTGLLVAVVIPAAAWTVRRAAVRAGQSPTPSWWRVAAATAVGLAGTPLFWALLWWRTGRADAWFVVERHGWDSNLDWGAQTLHFLHTALQHPDNFLGPVVCLIIIGYLLCCLLAAVERYPAPVVVLCAASVVLTLLSSTYWNSKPRLLLCAFPLVIPVAGALRRLTRPATVLVVVTATLISAWLGAYLLDVWPYAI